MADIKTLSQLSTTDVTPLQLQSAVELRHDGDVQDEAIQNLQNTTDALSQDLNFTQQNLTQTQNQVDNIATNVENIANALDDTNSQVDKNTNDIIQIEQYIGYYGSDVIGLNVDYENRSCERLANAIGLSAGSDFDKFEMYGGRKRCNVLDDGTISAWYGDSNYVEDGSNGQVMVYQPKFYYKVVPIKLEPISTGIGYHLRNVNYYVSATPKDGFKLHPAFYDVNGNEVDYFMYSAYEGCLWNASTETYNTNDTQNMVVGTDKLSSIANVKPCSGLTQELTRHNVETLAKNRGDGWHGDVIKTVSANQLLMIIEIGMMNMQTAIGQGVVSISDNSAYNCSSLTGSTYELGNGTGMATQTINEKGGVNTTETTNGKTSVIYRGVENPWGNIWKFIDGVNIWGNGQMGGGQPYICNDFNYAESKNADNYEGAGFTVTNKGGYISAMGYSTACDWLFMASECLGNSSVPVGDYTWVKTDLNGWFIALLGGSWNNGSYCGLCFWSLHNASSIRFRSIGSRLVYIPTN